VLERESVCVREIEAQTKSLTHTQTWTLPKPHFVWLTRKPDTKTHTHDIGAKHSRLHTHTHIHSSPKRKPNARTPTIIRVPVDFSPVCIASPPDARFDGLDETLLCVLFPKHPSARPPFRLSCSERPTNRPPPGLIVKPSASASDARSTNRAAVCMASYLGPQ